MKIARTAGLLILVLVCGVAGFLGWRVMEARSRTPALVAALVASADPQIAALPRARIEQYLAVEDPTFWTNMGVDLKTPGAGQTTVTQGLGKQIYFHPFKPGYWNKLQLILMSRYGLAAKASKADILTATLGHAYMGRVGGRDVEGLADGARTYFGKPLDQLTQDEYLALVALPAAPSRYQPLEHPQANAERVGRIKRLLAKTCAPTGLNDVALEGCRAG